MFLDSFTNAHRKADEALETSHISSDSSSEDLNFKIQPRKRQKPVRFQDDSDSESQSLIPPSPKRFSIPHLPQNDMRSSMSKHNTGKVAVYHLYSCIS